MDKLKEMLEELNSDVDYDTCDTLIDDHYLDSLSILSLVAEIEEEFDVVIPTVEIVPNNFNSMKNLWALIERLENE
ncbi:acyl carrier protein [bacterium]|nr:acyl carrier protein [bacterium]